MAIIKRIFQNPFYFLKNKRDVCFDLMKLWAMLSVVLDHSLFRWIENSQNTQLYNFIFLSQMPIFMFVAGGVALAQMHKIESFSNKQMALYFVKKILSLLIPFLAFVIIKAIILNNYSLIYRCFINPQLSLWFLWSLLWMEIGMLVSQFICIKLFSTQIKRLIFSILFYCAYLIPFLIIFIFNRNIFDLKLIIYYSLFFVFGYIVSSFDRKWFLNNKIVLCLSVLVSVTLIVVSMCLRPTMIFDDETPLNISIRVIGSIGVVSLFYVLFSLISRFAFVDYVSRIGRISLEMYFIHLLILLIPIFQNPVNGVHIFIGLYFLTLSVSFLAIILLKTNIVTDCLLFGKIRKVK